MNRGLGVALFAALGCGAAACSLRPPAPPKVAYYERVTTPWRIDVSYYPLKVAARAGTVVVLDSSANLGFQSSRVLRFDAKTHALVSSTVVPRGPRRGAKAAAVTMDAQGRAYVAVEGAMRTHLLRLTPGRPGAAEKQEWDAIGGGKYPAGLHLDPAGVLTLVDGGNHRIIRLLWKGTDPRVLGSSRELDTPRGVAVTADGAVYTKAGRKESALFRFGAAGGAPTRVEVPGFAETLAWFYNDLVAGPDGRLFLSDFEKKRVLLLSAEGKPAGELVDPAMKGPMGLAFDDEGALYVADAWAKHLLRFRPVYEKEAAARVKAGKPGPLPPPTESPPAKKDAAPVEKSAATGAD